MKGIQFAGIILQEGNNNGIENTGSCSGRLGPSIGSQIQLVSHLLPFLPCLQQNNPHNGFVNDKQQKARTEPEGSSCLPIASLKLNPQLCKSGFLPLKKAPTLSSRCLSSSGLARGSQLSGRYILDCCKSV